jgi:hypothetical protein
MRRAIVLGLLLCAGCTHVQVNAGSNTGASTGAQIQGSGGVAAVIVAGAVVAAAVSDLSFSEWFRGRPAPEMDPERTVIEQDCTRPIELSGNLKCR